MIAGIIVLLSVALALAYVVAWLLRPSFRRRIEAPKHAFQAQLRAYNRGMLDGREDRDRSRDEHP